MFLLYNAPFIHTTFNLNKGLTVYQANAGKKIMGTERPGNNSGFFIFNGNEIEIGIITIAKEIIENKKLKTISPLLFNQIIITQYITEAIRQIAIFKLIILSVFNTLEKSVSVAKK